MSKKAKKITVVLVVLLLPILIWGILFLKCEILTAFHGEKFTEVYKENTMMGEIEYLKILNYSDKEARIYYVSQDYLSGDILLFTNENDEWQYDSWERTVWSKQGSADGFVWPYVADALIYSLKMFQ